MDSDSDIAKAGESALCDEMGDGRRSHKVVVNVCKKNVL